MLLLRCFIEWSQLRPSYAWLSLLQHFKFLFFRRKFKGKQSCEFSCHVGKYKWCWGDHSCGEIGPGRLTSVWVWVQGWQHKGRDEKDLFSCICGVEEALPPKYCSLRQTRESSWHPHKNDVGASASFLWCGTSDVTLELIRMLWWHLVYALARVFKS